MSRAPRPSPGPPPLPRPSPGARPPPLPTTAPEDSPLTARHLEDLKAAARRMGAVRRGARFAKVNGTVALVIGVIAFLSLGFSVPDFLAGSFADLPMVLVVGLVIAAAVIELRQGRRLLLLDERAPLRLALNQLLIAATIGGYCVWKGYAAYRGGGLSGEAAAAISDLAQADPQMGALVSELAGTARRGMVAFYALVLSLTALFQSFAAFFYLRRRGSIAAYKRGTPAWIADLRRAGVL